MKPSPKPAQTFSTRFDAERFVAENDLAGTKHAQRVGGRWYLVPNRADVIGISQFIQCAIVEARRQGVLISVAEISAFASSLWRRTLRERKGQS